MIATALLFLLVGGDPEQTVPLTGGDIMLRDAAGALGVKATSNRVIARLPRDRRRVTMSRAAVAMLMQRATGKSAVRSEQNPHGSVTFVASRSTDVRRICRKLTRAVQTGESFLAADTTTASCGAAVAPLRRFPDRSVEALRALPVGAELGSVDLPSRKPIPTGTSAVMIVRSGPVEIARTVTSVQPGTPGSKVFVRDGEGHVFASRLAERTP